MSEDRDLFFYCCCIGGVPFEHSHCNGVSLRIGKEADDDLLLPLLFVPVVPIIGKLVLLPFEIGACHIVEKERRGCSMTGIEELFFYLLLIVGEPVEHLVEIVLADMIDAEHFLYRLFFRPPYRLAPASLDHEAGKDKECGETALFRPAEDRVETDLLCYLPQRKKRAYGLPLSQDPLAPAGGATLFRLRACRHLYRFNPHPGQSRQGLP